jgi:hypothetical protein
MAMAGWYRGAYHVICKRTHGPAVLSPIAAALTHSALKSCAPIEFPAGHVISKRDALYFAFSVQPHSPTQSENEVIVSISRLIITLKLRRTYMQ